MRVTYIVREFVLPDGRKCVTIGASSPEFDGVCNVVITLDNLDDAPAMLASAIVVLRKAVKFGVSGGGMELETVVVL